MLKIPDRQWRRGHRPPPALAAALLALLTLSGCSLRQMAINTMADTLAASGDVYASDNDPELIRHALPFSLKTIESLLESSPRHPGLLLTACSGFTSYAYGFAETDAELLDQAAYDEYVALRDRARRLYLRGRDYCLRGLELRFAGVTARLQGDPVAAVRPATVRDVPLLYWTGASWGGAIALGLDEPALVADLPAVRALMDRALALDEQYDEGAIHQVMIALESLPESMGGSPDRARTHFARAVDLSDGQSAGAYVTLATSVSVPAQDREEFEQLLQQALAIDPDKDPSRRLANLITQRRARHLLERIDELFLPPLPDEAAVRLDQP